MIRLLSKESWALGLLHSTTGIPVPSWFKTHISRRSQGGIQNQQRRPRIIWLISLQFLMIFSMGFYMLLRSVGESIPFPVDCNNAKETSYCRTNHDRWQKRTGLAMGQTSNHRPHLGAPLRNGHGCDSKLSPPMGLSFRLKILTSKLFVSCCTSYEYHW